MAPKATAITRRSKPVRPQVQLLKDSEDALSSEASGSEQAGQQPGTPGSQTSSESGDSGSSGGSGGDGNDSDGTSMEEQVEVSFDQTHRTVITSTRLALLWLIEMPVKFNSGPQWHRMRFGRNERAPGEQVDIEFFDPMKTDFHGIKALIQGLLGGETFDVSGLADAIIDQVRHILTPLTSCNGQAKTSRSQPGCSLESHTRII